MSSAQACAWGTSRSQTGPGGKLHARKEGIYGPHSAFRPQALRGLVHPLLQHGLYQAVDLKSLAVRISAQEGILKDLCDSVIERKRVCSYRTQHRPKFQGSLAEHFSVGALPRLSFPSRCSQRKAPKWWRWGQGGLTPSCRGV